MMTMMTCRTPSFSKECCAASGFATVREKARKQEERPQLVAPPSRDLPAPVTAGSLAATNPAWPADPDEKRRNAERKAKAERKPYDVYKSGDALRPNELAAGKTDKPAMKTSQGPDHSPEMTPSELGYTGGLWSGFMGLGKSFGKDRDDETAKFVRERSRSTPTDPPVGSRTPSPAQPYGINGKSEKPKAAPDDRQTGDFGK